MLDKIFYEKVSNYLLDKDLDFLDLRFYQNVNNTLWFFPKKEKLPGWWYLEIIGEFDTIRTSDTYLNIYNSFLRVLSKSIIIYQENFSDLPRLRLVEENKLYGFPIDFILTLFKVALFIFEFTNNPNLELESSEIKSNIKYRKLTLIKKEKINEN